MSSSGSPWPPDADVAALVEADPLVAGVVAAIGPPPPFRRPWTLRTIVHVVLEQQLSLDAAAAHLDALEQALGGVPTAALLRGLDRHVARAAGVSRQKHRTLVAVGEAVASGVLDLDAIAWMADDDARRAITAVPGLGPWSADVLLLGALDRPDVWPVGDRALRVATAEALGLSSVPDAHELLAIGDRWRPRRSAAARVLWHSYLVRRGRSVPVTHEDS